MKQKNKRVDYITGGTESEDNYVDADFLNQAQEELENVVRAGGFAFDGNNEQQVAQTITDHALGASYAEDTGTANNYILSITGSRQAPPVLVKGYRLFFQTGNVNTSTTPTLNYAGLGVKTIIDENGTNAILPGDIKVGVYNQVVYDGTNWRLVLPRIPNASETVKGISQFSTTSEVNDGNSTNTGISPSKLKEKLNTLVTTQIIGNQQVYIVKKYDGTIIRQEITCHETSILPPATDAIRTFAVPFPATPQVFFIGVNLASPDNAVFVPQRKFTNSTTCTIGNYDLDSSLTSWFWHAIFTA